MTNTPQHSPAAWPQEGRRRRHRAPAPVLVAVAGPVKQGRATVAFRIILAIPHFFVLYFLGIVASVVCVIGWFGALFTGRLPFFAAAYLSGYVRWYSRVGAYVLLLTDEYPPFSSEDAAYPVRMAVGPNRRLSRLAVLFRIILAIPAAILSMILLTGVETAVIFIAWLAALIAGKLPGSLHHAFAAVLRYITRYNSFLYLLTDAYPRGLFGDESGTQTGPEDLADDPGYGTPGPGYGAPDPGYGAPDPGYGAPAARYGGHGAPMPGYGTAGYRTPDYWTPPAPAYQAPAAGPSGQPPNWKMVLPAGAKRLLGLILALGLLTTIGGGVSAGVVLQQVSEINQLNAAIAQHNNAVVQNQKAIDQANNAIDQVTSAHAKFVSKVDASVGSLRACSTLSCFDASAGKAASSLAVFGRKLHAVAIPAGAVAAADKLARDTARARRTWLKMRHAVSFTDFANKAKRSQKVGKEFDRDYSALTRTLNKIGDALNRQSAALNQRASSLNRQAAALKTGWARIFGEPSSAAAAVK